MFKNLSWRKRDSTDHILVVLRDLKGVDTNTLRIMAIRRGNFDLGYHLVIRKNGVIENARPDYAYAGEWFDDCEHSLAVLVDTPEKETSSQKIALETLKKKYPKATVEYVNISEDEEW